LKLKEIMEKETKSEDKKELGRDEAYENRKVTPASDNVGNKSGGETNMSVPG
jgi:hypothetical protein